MVTLLVYFANDQIVGQFLGRRVMLVTAFPANGKSKVKYTTECEELCRFYFHITTLSWFLCHQHHSDKYLYSFLTIWLRQKEALCQKNEAETRPCFGMVSDCIHHTAAGTEFSHASMLCVQKTTTAIKMLLCDEVNIPSRHFKMEDKCKNATSKFPSAMGPCTEDHLCKSWFWQMKKREISQFSNY